PRGEPCSAALHGACQTCTGVTRAADPGAIRHLGAKERHANRRVQPYDYRYRVNANQMISATTTSSANGNRLRLLFLSRSVMSWVWSIMPIVNASPGPPPLRGSRTFRERDECLEHLGEVARHHRTDLVAARAGGLDRVRDPRAADERLDPMRDAHDELAEPGLVDELALRRDVD